MIIFYELDFVRTAMKTSILIFVLFFVSGCAIFQPEETIIIQPKLLKQSSLPPITSSIYSDNFEFTCELIVNEKGDVEKAKLLTQSGDPTWDSLATLSLLEWKFAPATANGIPIKQLIRRRVKVVFEQPEIVPLAEIQLNNYQLADSIYNAIVNGADFSDMAKKYSLSNTKLKGGMLGNVDIKQYSKNISSVLHRLKGGEITEPLVFGDRFIIFKKLVQNN